MLSQRQAARTEFDFIICVKNLTMSFLHTLKDFSGSVMDSELTVRIGNAHQKQYKTSRDYEYYIRPLNNPLERNNGRQSKPFRNHTIQNPGRKETKVSTRKHTASTTVMAASRSAPPDRLYPNFLWLDRAPGYLPCCKTKR